MRIRLYTRSIEIKNGKECLYRDISVDEKFATVEEAEKYAHEIIDRNNKYFKEYPEFKHLHNRIGINFKIKDLDTKEVIKTFPIYY